MIEAWTDRAATYSDSSRMDQFTGFASDFRSEFFQRGLETSRRPIVQSGVFFAKPPSRSIAPGLFSVFSTASGSNGYSSVKKYPIQSGTSLKSFIFSFTISNTFRRYASSRYRNAGFLDKRFA